jgi:ATP-binding cassette subfamily B protein
MLYKSKKSQGLAGEVRQLAQSVRLWGRAFSLIWAAAPRWTVFWAILLIGQGILPLASVYLTKLVIDSLVAAVKASGSAGHLRSTLWLIGLMIGVLLLTDLFQSLTELARTAQSELVQDHIKGLVHVQASSMDLSVHETSTYQDRLDRARNEASSRPLALLEGCGSLVQNGITLLAMAAVLLPFSNWLPLILFLSTVPAFVIVLRFGRRYHQWWQERTQERRRTQYYDLLLTVQNTAAELRLFGLNAHLQSAYQNLRRLLRSERLKLIRDQGLARLGAGAFAQLAAGGALIWMMWRVMLGAVSLGDLALFYQAFSRGQGLMRTLLGNLGQIYNNSMFLENLFNFLDMKPQVLDPAQPHAPMAKVERGIEFRNVTFRYPKREQFALRDFNLSLPAGKIVAVVGANGAGKTTLLKLLCRFYDPDSGRIEIDGVDIRNFRLEDLRKMLAVLFQFPINYQATVEQCIAFGDFPANPSRTDVESAARSAGADEFIDGLPRGYESQLGTAFADGVELSGGEWHRISTARAYIRKSPIILLDEPTSMMDSWSETEWFERFRALTGGRTALMITHRFTIAMRADVIHVMQDGEIVESGSHAQLVANKGIYAQSWTAQVEAGSNEGGPNVATFIYHEDFATQRAEM